MPTDFTRAVEEIDRIKQCALGDPSSVPPEALCEMTDAALKIKNEEMPKFLKRTHIYGPKMQQRVRDLEKRVSEICESLSPLAKKATSEPVLASQRTQTLANVLRKRRVCRP